MHKYFEDTAIVFCSDDAHLDASSSNYGRDQVRLKEAALLFSNVVPIGGSYGGWLSHTKT